jgi:hypothetical protein
MSSNRRRVSGRTLGSDWLLPLIEDSHILALSLSVGMIVILNLCLLSSLYFFWGESLRHECGWIKYLAVFSGAHITPMRRKRVAAPKIHPAHARISAKVPFRRCPSSLELPPCRNQLGAVNRDVIKILAAN